MWLRMILRNLFFCLMRRFFATSDAKDILINTLSGLLHSHITVYQNDYLDFKNPYFDISKPKEKKKTFNQKTVVFISGRFRSGSTLLWNIFRNIPSCTSYYEPFNEAAWSSNRRWGNSVDNTHKGVAEYWNEYDELEFIRTFYKSRWSTKNLYMDEVFWDPELSHFIDLLINNAPERPVLQFNRVDFRLAWLRHNYPNAKIVHIFRHPRDQWCSTLRDISCFSKDARISNFEQYDRFYLLEWVNDLRAYFPFLDQYVCKHPYELFYYIWCLSYMFGKRYSDYSICFEDLVSDPNVQILRLLNSLQIKGYRLNKLKSLIMKPSLNKWKQYADEMWFKNYEAQCEDTLTSYFLTR